MAEEQKENKKDSSDEPSEKKPGEDLSQDNSSSGGSLTGPEGILMLMAAGLLDCLGFGLALFSWAGADDYGVLDLMGFLIIGGWMLMRGMNAGSAANKAGGAIKRFIGTSIVEVIPVIGGISPSWTWLVWKELKGKKSKSGLLGKIGSGLKNIAGKSAKAVASPFAETGRAFKDVGKDIAGSKFGQKTAKFGGAVAGGIATGAEVAKKGVSKGAEWAADKTAAGYQATKEGVKATTGAVTEQVSGVAGAVKDAFTKDVKSSFKAVGTDLVGERGAKIIGRGAEMVGKAGKGIVNEVVELGKGAPAAMNTLGKGAGYVGGLATKAKQKTTEGIKVATGAVTEQVSGVAGAVKDAFTKDVGSSFKAVGKDIVGERGARIIGRGVEIAGKAGKGIAGEIVELGRGAPAAMSTMGRGAKATKDWTVERGKQIQKAAGLENWRDDLSKEVDEAVAPFREIKDTVYKGVKGAENMARDARDIAGFAKDQVIKSTKNVADATGKWTGKKFETIKGELDEAVPLDAVGKAISGAVGSIGGAAAKAGGAVAGGVSAGYKATAKSVGKGAGVAKEGVKKFTKTVGDGLTEDIPLGEAVRQAGKALVAPGKAVKRKAESKAKSLIWNLKKGVLDQLKQIEEKGDIKIAPTGRQETNRLKRELKKKAEADLITKKFTTPGTIKLDEDIYQEKISDMPRTDTTLKQAQRRQNEAERKLRGESDALDFEEKTSEDIYREPIEDLSPEQEQIKQQRLKQRRKTGESNATFDNGVGSSSEENPDKNKNTVKQNIQLKDIPKTDKILDKLIRVGHKEMTVGAGIKEIKGLLPKPNNTNNRKIITILRAIKKLVSYNGALDLLDELIRESRKSWTTAGTESGGYFNRIELARIENLLEKQNDQKKAA